MGRIVIRGTRDNPRVYADYYDVDRTRRTRLLRGARTKLEGRKLLADIESRVAAGKPGMEVDEVQPPPAPGEALCGPLMDEWLGGLTNRNAADDRSRVLRDVRPVWADVTVHEAQKLVGVMRWLTKLRKSELSGQSQRHALNAFSRFMAWAVEHGYAEVNPVRMVPQGKRPQAAPKQADAPWLRDDETFRKLVAAIPSPVSLMFWLGNRSGLRLGEVCGLRMEDFAWVSDGIIRAEHSYGGPLKEDKGHGPAPKAKWVPAAMDVEQVMGPWLKKRKKEGAGPTDLVFPFQALKPQNRKRTSGWTGYRKEYVESVWSKVVDDLRVKLSWYEATRHSFVSRNLAAGVPLDEVSSAVGHSSPVVTMRFYARNVRKSFSPEIRGAAIK
jgi:integrase